MKFSTVAVITTLTALASAVPVRRQNGVAGAVYFLTNEPDGSFIVSSDIGQDGKLTLRQATKTGGRGGHGVTDPNGPDAMFSQGSVKVAGQNVFAVNPGSSTVSMFAIDPKDPAKLTMVGQPVSSGGDFPVSVAISKKTGQVCVLNGGRSNGVNCFKQDKDLGLIQIDNTQRSLSLNQTTAPNGPAGTVSHVIFSEDDSKLIASVKGVPPQPGFLASWDVDQNSGVLSQDFVKSTPGKGGLLPFGMTIIPGKNAVLATDAGIGFDIFDFSQQSGSGKQAKGASSKVFAINGQKAVCWTAFSKKTNDFFMTDIGTGLITEVNVDNNLNAKLIKQYSTVGQNASLIDLDIATVGNKDFMYTMSAGTQSVLVHSLDAPGKANLIQTLKFADAAKNAGLKTEANNLQGMTAFIIGA